MNVGQVRLVERADGVKDEDEASEEDEVQRHGFGEVSGRPGQGQREGG